MDAAGQHDWHDKAEQDTALEQGNDFDECAAGQRKRKEVPWVSALLHKVARTQADEAKTVFTFGSAPAERMPTQRLTVRAVPKNPAVRGCPRPPTHPPPQHLLPKPKHLNDGWVLLRHI